MATAKLPSIETANATAKETNVSNKTENTTAKPATTKKAAKKTTKPETVTMTKEDLAAIVQSAVTAAVAAVKPARASGGSKAAKAAEKAAKKEKAAKERAERKASNDGLKQAHAEATGKSLDEVKAAWTEAHKYAREDQSQYKARFDAKLKELIGQTRFVQAA